MSKKYHCGLLLKPLFMMNWQQKWILLTLVFKTKYQTDKAELEIKTFDVTGFVKKTKLTELETKVPHKISSLVKKADYDTKISELEKKITGQNRDQYITTR